MRKIQRQRGQAFHKLPQKMYDEFSTTLEAQTMTTDGSSDVSYQLQKSGTSSSSADFSAQQSVKLNDLKESISLHLMTFADQIEKAFDKITTQIQMQGEEATKKTFESVYTQTTPESAENVVHAELENNLDNTIKRKVSEPQPEMPKSIKQHSGYDNVTIEAPKATESRSTSLQTRVKLDMVPRQCKSLIHVNRGKFDERECLANALQFHIDDLVDGIVFHESELPDCLLAEGCLTEDECSTVRKLRDRKDQIRVLVSHIKGRDLRVLNGFMKHIQQHNPDVAKTITEKFESNKRDGVRGKVCAVCKLENQFNVKHVADSLWSVQVIDDGLYNRIIHSDEPTGAQSVLWKSVFRSLNCLEQQIKELAHKKLLSALTSKNQFMHLAEGINTILIRNHGQLICTCELKLVLTPTRNSFLGATNSGESILPDSSSDDSSIDIRSSKTDKSLTDSLFSRNEGAFDTLSLTPKYHASKS